MSLSYIDGLWAENNPGYIRMSGMDDNRPVLGRIERSSFYQHGQPPLSIEDVRLLLQKNMVAFRRIFMAKYERGGYSEVVGPSNVLFRLVDITREDITASGEQIDYDTPPRQI